MILGFSIGTIASAFNGCTFSTTFGLTFWLLNAALYQAFDVRLQSLPQRIRRGFEQRCVVDRIDVCVENRAVARIQLG